VGGGRGHAHEKTQKREEGRADDEAGVGVGVVLPPPRMVCARGERESVEEGKIDREWVSE